MTIHALLTDAPLVQRVGRTLVNTVWQGLAAAALLRMALAVVRQSARWRYAMGCLAMVAFAAAAAITFGLTGPAATRLAVTPPVTQTTAAFPSSDSPLPTVAARPAFDQRSLTALVVLLWAMGVAGQTSWQTVGWVRVRRLAREPVMAHDRWTATLRLAADRVGVRRAVRLLSSTRVDVPVVLGVLRPAIVVPLSLLADLPVEHVEAILAHELAHVRRHDYLVNLVQCGVEAVFFYHPAMWWISAVVRREREHCCDDVAAAAIGSRTSVASALLALDRWRGPQLTMAATGSPVLARVRRLTAGASPRHPAGSMSVALITVVVAVGILLAEGRHAALAQLAPPATTRPTATDREAGVVYVGGDVRRQGVYAILDHGPRTIGQTVVSAGLPNVPRVWVSVIRHDGDRTVRVVDGLPFAAPWHGMPGDFRLEPDDVIRVSTVGPVRPASQPAAAFGGEVYIGGDVPRVGVYSIDPNHPMTASQIVIGAGDINVEHGRQAWVSVYRCMGTERAKLLDEVPFASLLDGALPDLRLEPRDVVMVFSSDPATRAVQWTPAAALWDQKYRPKVNYADGRPSNLAAIEGEWRQEVGALPRTAAASGPAARPATVVPGERLPSLAR